MESAPAAETVPSTQTSYNATMFESAEVTGQLTLNDVENVAGPDRSQLLKMLEEGKITASTFIELDNAIMSNNGKNVSNVNAEIFKGFKGNIVNLNNVTNGVRKK
ncbi:hypothetical protein BDQ17DRAFT_1404587 [Cyathus striatus]|nr:hypothetical protein BDQ17DRAFT_1404587 [Cyathus striatus]